MTGEQATEKATKESDRSGQASAAASDAIYYVIALVSGAAVGYVSVRVEDLLLSAVLIACACMFLGFMRPRHMWRWMILVPIFIPLGQLLAYKVAGQRISRWDLSGALTALFPSIAGTACGAVARKAIYHLWQEK
jgi:hypothetical protein